MRLTKGSLLGLGKDLVHAGPADRALALKGFAAVLHLHDGAVFHRLLRFTLYAIRNFIGHVASLKVVSLSVAAFLHDAIKKAPDTQDGTAECVWGGLFTFGRRGVAFGTELTPQRDY